MEERQDPFGYAPVLEFNRLSIRLSVRRAPKAGVRARCYGQGVWSPAPRGGEVGVAASSSSRSLGSETTGLGARPSAGTRCRNRYLGSTAVQGSPGAKATPWAKAREVLETAQLSWVTTVRGDGRPHVTPLVSVWLDDAVHFTTGPGEQKAVNLASNPHVVMTTGCNRWDQELDVMVEGEAQRVTDRATLERLAAAWATVERPMAVRGG